VVVKFNNVPPITLVGEWNVSRSIPVYRAYGQGQVDPQTGSVTPGSGYIGSAKGTAQGVSGSFRFTVDATGELAQAQVLALQTGAFFTADWPVGDPAAALYRAKAIDCHFDSVSFSHDGPNGKYELTGSMSAGKLDIFQ
jgi:hypothetical protein